MSRCIDSVGRSLIRIGELMQLSARGLIERGVSVLRGFAVRFRRGGRRSAWVYAKWCCLDAYVRLRNRLSRRPLAECPCCGWQGYDFLMLDCGTFTVPSVACPHCQAHERHRMLHLYLHRRDPSFFSAAGRVLHFAPEHHVRTLIAANPSLLCTSTDYALHMVRQLGGAGLQTDMQCLGLADDAFDLAFCLHVLEHVPDDRKGIGELHRVLKHGGVAYVMVPFMMGWEKTVEFGRPDPDIFDHVRGYSLSDFSERLAPLEYEEILPGTFLSEDEIRRYRIPDSQVIYRCTK